jgi:hypothetical protein
MKNLTAIKKGQRMKNMHGRMCEITYVSYKRDLVILCDGSRYSIPYSSQINNL